jgi:hypothetical protein
MFEEYLQDSHEFYTIAIKAKDSNDIDKARRYFRVSIICAFSALEAFVNYTAKSFEEANNLDRLEISFLNDKELYFSATQGIKTRIKYNPIDEKLKVLVKRFVTDYDFAKEVAWSNLLKFKDFRDSLIHSRAPEDETVLSDYDQQVISGFRAIIELMDLISIGIYKKSLRKSILDLIPE